MDFVQYFSQIQERAAFKKRNCWSRFRFLVCGGGIFPKWSIHYMFLVKLVAWKTIQIMMFTFCKKLHPVFYFWLLPVVSELLVECGLETVKTKIWLDSGETRYVDEWMFATIMCYLLVVTNGILENQQSKARDRQAMRSRLPRLVLDVNNLNTVPLWRRYCQIIQGWRCRQLESCFRLRFLGCMGRPSYFSIFSPERSKHAGGRACPDQNVDKEPRAVYCWKVGKNAKCRRRST